MRHAFEPDPAFRAKHLEAETRTGCRQRSEISGHAFFHPEENRGRVVAVDFDSAPEALAVNVVDWTAQIDHAVDRVNTHRSQSAARCFLPIGAPLRGLQQ